MKELNVVLTELGISKVRLAKYLGVSRQMLYNYLAIDNISNWPKEKAAKFKGIDLFYRWRRYLSERKAGLWDCLCFCEEDRKYEICAGLGL